MQKIKKIRRCFMEVSCFGKNRDNYRIFLCGMGGKPGIAGNTVKKEQSGAASFGCITGDFIVMRNQRDAGGVVAFL